MSNNADLLQQPIARLSETKRPPDALDHKRPAGVPVGYNASRIASPPDMLQVPGSSS
ncbi:hypothetical protein PARPLA_00119 [Rhodobacteraceae bacterium THAF1]|nr:hypothetical protein FIU81_00035 [Palleronia sp. THAF1]VDC16779.1 hypothetical protein PARPLA_00119 [Rhodobacteraceae bacterium THAF1]